MCCGSGVRERVGQATEDVAALVRLVHNLLDVARITAGRIDLEIEEVELSALVTQVVNRFRRLGARIVLNLKPVIGRWDRLRIEQIVSNLVSNAFKYGGGKPIEVTVTADARCARLIGARDKIARVLHN